jgi:hypothetical protein
MNTSSDSACEDARGENRTLSKKEGLYVWNTLGSYGHLPHLARHSLDLSVADKLIGSNVVLFDPGTHKRLAHSSHLCGRSGKVVDGALEVGQMPAQHLLVYPSRLALPFLLGFRHFCHGADQVKIWICRLQSRQSVQECSIFGLPIGIEQV